MARLGAVMAAFCDHAEHAEPTDPVSVAEAGTELIDLAFEIADFERKDLLRLYGGRLAADEHSSTLEPGNGMEVFGEVRAAETLRDLQVIQNRHNRRFHPDVAGMSRIAQIRHFSFHVSKLTGSVAEQIGTARPSEEFISRRLPDMLVIGILLATAANQRLPSTEPPEFFD